MGLPNKALREREFKTKVRIGEGSHETYHVTWGDPPEVQEGFFKVLNATHYPEFLAKISVATSSLKQSAVGNRSAQEMLVFDAEDKIVGTLSVAVKDFKPLNFRSERVPENPEERERVIPSTERLIEANAMESIFSDWFNGNNDAHPHNIGYIPPSTGQKIGYFFNIDFDMFFYWFTVYMKGGPRPTLSAPKTRINLTIRDYENFPCIEEEDYFHWYTFDHPGKKSLPTLLPDMIQNPLLAATLTKTYAAPEQFAALAANPRAQEQKFAVALKTLLSFQPEVQRQRLRELLGELKLNYKSLMPEVRVQYERLFPKLCNDTSNEQSFVDFMMKLYQEHYDNLYRVVVFYMGCERNNYGVPLTATYTTFYKKPSFYQNIKGWIIAQNETIYVDPDVQFDLNELEQRYHQIWRDAFTPSLEELRRSIFSLLNEVRVLITTTGETEDMQCRDVTDTELTDSWQLFSKMPDFSLKEEEITVDPHSGLRSGFLLLRNFALHLERLINNYYRKSREQLRPEDSHLFASTLDTLCNEKETLDIIQFFAHSSSYALKFVQIKRVLKQFAAQVNFRAHLVSTDEQMQETPHVLEREPLPYIHADVMQNFNKTLFLWAQSLPSEKFNQYIIEVVERKYSAAYFKYFRQRSEAVKHYLTTIMERNDNKLGYILSSGKVDDGALNQLLVEELTQLMLQQHHLPSITLAMREKDLSKKKDVIVNLTRSAVDFAKKDPNLIHLYSVRGYELFYETLYNWIETIPREHLDKIISTATVDYDRTKWLFTTASRTSEIKKNFAVYNPAKALALTFIGGEGSSTASQYILLEIIKAIKDELSKNPEKLNEWGYKLIQQFIPAEHKEFYMEHMKNQVTIKRTHHQEMTEQWELTMS